MKKVFIFTLIILGAMTFMMQDAMARPDKAPKTPKFNAVSRLAHAGDIHGNVSCFEGVTVVSGANLVFVFIPGTSFIAIPDTTTGDFTIYNVPAGAYDVQIVADTGPSPSSGVTMPVNVVGKTISELCTTEP